MEQFIFSIKMVCLYIKDYFSRKPQCYSLHIQANHVETHQFEHTTKNALQVFTDEYLERKTGSIHVYEYIFKHETYRFSITTNIENDMDKPLSISILINPAFPNEFWMNEHENNSTKLKINDDTYFT
jgi:hypothetical protein